MEIGLLLIVVCLLGAGIFYLFRPGRRWFGVKLIAAGPVVFVVGALLLGQLGLARYAVEQGFESISDMAAAKRAGIDDPAQWVEHKAAMEEEARRNEAEAARAERERVEREETERRRKGFHCLSGWDGSHRAVVRYVRGVMREPDSFEHIETRITPVGEDGQHTLFMRYRARNGFGGMSVGMAVATVGNDDCSVTITSVE